MIVCEIARDDDHPKKTTKFGHVVSDQLSKVYTLSGMNELDLVIHPVND